MPLTLLELALHSPSLEELVDEEARGEEEGQAQPDSQASLGGGVMRDGTG